MTNEKIPTTINPSLRIGTWLVSAVAILLTLAHGLDLVALPPLVPTIARWAAIALLSVVCWQRSNLTVWILFSMVIGVEVGYDFPAFGKELDIFSSIFIQLIKTIIAPLLFATLVIGIAGHANLRDMGRLGLKTIVYFEIVTTVALFIGLGAINLTRAGDGIKKEAVSEKLNVTPTDLTMKMDTTGGGGKLTANYGDKSVEFVSPKKRDGWKEIVLHIFPSNIAKSVADGQVLQIVVFSILFAMGLMFVEAKHKTTMIDFCDSLAHVMFQFTNFVMKLAPIAVGGAIAHTVGDKGIDVLKNLGVLVLTLYGALAVFILLVFVPLMIWLKIPIKRFINHVSEPATLAFATSSSESALPLALKNMEKFGVPRKIVAFVLPTGYSFNLDGSTLYLSLATIFVAQAAGLEIGIGQQIVIVLTLMLTSKGVAGVSRASLVILAGTCAQFDLPDWPIALILGVDVLMDMGRTSVNLIGNCLATAVMARWEGEAQWDDEAS
ncbi:MAG: cation:dicarboxylase symporter family transporter [Saprospiraceae bacterium]|nr:cation:dicarboxylase symporter family transporter [Saprospiraceae bacterium]